MAAGHQVRRAGLLVSKAGHHIQQLGAHVQRIQVLYERGYLNATKAQSYTNLLEAEFYRLYEQLYELSGTLPEAPNYLAAPGPQGIKGREAQQRVFQLYRKCASGVLGASRYGAGYLGKLPTKGAPHVDLADVATFKDREPIHPLPDGPRPFAGIYNKRFQKDANQEPGSGSPGAE